MKRHFVCSVLELFGLSLDIFPMSCYYVTLDYFLRHQLCTSLFISLFLSSSYKRTYLYHFSAEQDVIYCFSSDLPVHAGRFQFASSLASPSCDSRSVFGCCYGKLTLSTNLIGVVLMNNAKK